MISSTIEDLEIERSAVDRAIKQFYFQRFRSELIGSLAKSPRETCEEIARTCDVYILIVGQRYGWVIPELGISVTELEYRTATDADPSKILVYVKAVPENVRELRATEFAAKATDFSKGYFRAAPFTTADELYEQVKADLGAWVSDRIIKRSLSPSTVFGLPDTREIGASLRNLAVITIGIFLVSWVGRRWGSEFLPGPYQIFKSMLGDPLIGLSLFRLMLISISQSAFALAGWAAMIASLQLFTSPVRTILFRAMTPILVLALLSLVAFGMMVHGTDAPFLAGTLASAIYLNYGIRKEVVSLNRQRSWTSRWELVRTLAINLLLSPLIPNAFVVAASTTLIYEAWFGVNDRAVSQLLRSALAFYRLDRFVGVIIATVSVLYCAHVLIRLLQARVGWSYIRQQVLRKPEAPAVSRAVQEA